MFTGAAASSHKQTFLRCYSFRLLCLCRRATHFAARVAYGNSKCNARKKQERQTDSMKESLLRKELLRQTENYWYFMKHEGSLPCSQKLVIPIRSQINPVHNRLPDLTYTWTLSCRQRRLTKSSLFPSGFPTKTLHPFLFRPTYPIILDFITRIFGMEYKSWNSSGNFFSHTLFPVSYIQILSSSTRSRIPSAYVRFLILE